MLKEVIKEVIKEVRVEVPVPVVTEKPIVHHVSYKAPTPS